MAAYYNENYPFCAQWLRNLISRGLIAPGEVDERDIREVRAADVRGFEQCHFFAGIGGWSYALRLAGWDDARPVWTGSCPCQPFSTAGKQRGFADERHLWPVWFELIRECAPVIIFGEQVASALAWCDLVSRDLEGEGYACGASIVGAHSVGAPHIRQRLYWVGDSTKHRNRAFNRHPGSSIGQEISVRGSGFSCSLPDRLGPRLEIWREQQTRGERQAVERSGPAGSPWADIEWLPCRDGKSRAVEPGSFPLAHGIPGRVGQLRAYGNAIVPQVAAAFIAAAMELSCMPPPAGVR